MIYYFIIFMALFFTVAPVNSEILFKDASEEAGIHRISPTAASSWGDLNNDGWPDLWISNHHGLSPTLFVNQKNGSFIDLSGEALPSDLRADFHGAAWADYDNDGDQDIIAVTGGAAGRGSSPNFLFVNENGKLTNKAEELGVSYPLGRGRTPLWFDADRDGKLDLLLMNRPRDNASSALFLQQSQGFINRTQALHFFQGARSTKEKIFSGIDQLLNLDYPSVSNEVNVSNEFAQLADLSSDNQANLIAFMQPSRLYSIGSAKLNDITAQITLPNIKSIEDVAMGDFDGDGQIDMFFTRAKAWAWNVIQDSAHSIRGRMGNKSGKPSTVVFRTSGEVTFEVHRPWMDPSDTTKDVYPDLFLGSKQEKLKETRFKISPENPHVREAASDFKKNAAGVSIEYEPETNLWTLNNQGQSIGFIITSSKTIESTEVKGFKPQAGGVKDILLLRKGNEYASKKLKLTDNITSCSSITAGDFDNDMDLDLYLVCTGPVQNQSNILYENDGKANFSKVRKSGGAEGSQQGRGNQVAMADYDLDGFLDLFVTNGVGAPPFADEGPYELYKNLGNSNNWLQIDLKGISSNRDGIGAKIILQANGKTQIRQKDGGIHSFSQNYGRLHFGLGPNDKAELLTVYWPSGVVQRLENVSANQILMVEEQAQ